MNLRHSTQDNLLHRTGAMHNAGGELPRMPIPRSLGISKSAVRSATRKVPGIENSSELATQEGGDGDYASHHAGEFRERPYPARDLDPPDRPERSARARSRLLCKPRGQLHRGRDAKGHG